ncbi:MAG TPA: AraC family transcriptional regulator [Kofleriaceae bacterium]|nr:AraC family transcriptional regulator [Kofleriaceae bacterium]
MQRGTVDDMARSPVGRYVVGETFVHFCAAPTLWGLIIWGRFDESHAAALGPSLVKELAPPAVAHASILDASRLEATDPKAFQAGDAYLTRYRELLGNRLSRLALVRPGGMSGAVVAGAFEVLPRPYPARVFADAGAAFGWLVDEGGAPDWPSDGAAFVAELYAEAAGTPAILGALRALLEAKLAGPPVADAARELGVSDRTLQRKLGELGTTFQHELSEARVRVAKRLLVDSDAPVTNIALDVGCASLQHFSALFRKHEGESPSAFRKRRRS